MHSRCENPGTDSYEYYGAKGVMVCEEWGKFEPFFEWAKANGYGEGLLIDRIDTFGNYHPDNCQWVDATASANNTRKNVFVVAFGETKTVSQWARDARCLVNQNMLYQRIRRGMLPETAMTAGKMKNQFQPKAG